MSFSLVSCVRKFPEDMAAMSYLGGDWLESEPTTRMELSFSRLSPKHEIYHLSPLFWNPRVQRRLGVTVPFTVRRGVARPPPHCLAPIGRPTM
ncbi:hypothetical protein RRG08_029206 [Elysia crispata]|uniref:Uncharacterized protein n=1 Tax=Elysia crispata TaxID=231223 RepID=A0AAE1AKF8_9GAST|nr:hypothetical protein RRG08_029206 [Elysia crispata]